MAFSGTALEPSTPSPTIKKRPRNEGSQKLRQVLNYSSSVDKVSELLGVDAPKVYEIYKEQAEGELQKRKLSNTLNKRNSQKALSLLGHDPSTEKVKSTLGIDEQAIHDAYMQNALSRPMRRVETSMNKRKYAKALTTLGFNLSLYKATQLLGVDEDILRTVFRYHTEHALQEEHRAWQRALQCKALRDKKHNRKALHVIGYDPSLEKVLSMLGVEEGTQEEVQVGSILPVENRQREAPLSSSSSHFQATALVYALSAAILLSSLRHNL